MYSENWLGLQPITVYETSSNISSPHQFLCSSSMELRLHSRC